MANGLMKPILTALGGVSLMLGMAGLLIPVLPTTPFLLLSAGCWLRSSARLHRWLMGQRTLGPLLQNYLSHRAVSRQTRRWTLAFLWTGLALSAWIHGGVVVSLILLGIGVAVSIHLMLLRVLDD